MFKSAFRETNSALSDILADSVSSLLTFLLCATVALASANFAHAKDSFALPGGELLEDPTKPKHYVAPKTVVKKASAPQSFKLNYVLASASRKYAVINGKKVSVGGLISGARVLAIEPQKVVLNVAGNKRTLTLNKVKGIKQ